MAFTKHNGSTIIGISAVVPSHTANNLELNLLSSEEREALVNHTGIKYRKLTQKQDSIVTYFEKSIETIMTKTKWNPAEIDVLICVTQTPSMIIPSVSSRIHGNLNFPTSTICFDIVSGCAGFVYGLNTVYSLLSSIVGKKSKAILCCGDFSTHLIESIDKSVVPIFSDGVAAIAIEYDSENTNTISYFNLESDGKGQHAIEMQPINDHQSYMRLNGIDVFGYSVKHVPANIENLLVTADKTKEDTSWFVFHQANKLINESIRKKLQLQAQQVPYSIEEYGNTASASIPITIAANWQDFPKQNSSIVVAGFGVGFSMASAWLTFQPDFCTIEEF